MTPTSLPLINRNYRLAEIEPLTRMFCITASDDLDHQATDAIVMSIQIQLAL